MQATVLIPLIRISVSPPPIWTPHYSFFFPSTLIPFESIRLQLSYPQPIPTKNRRNFPSHTRTWHQSHLPSAFPVFTPSYIKLNSRFPTQLCRPHSLIQPPVISSCPISSIPTNPITLPLLHWNHGTPSHITVTPNRSYLTSHDLEIPGT